VLVGAALAARKRVGVPWPGLRTAVLYATCLEVGQLLVPGRYPDVTDIMMTSAAAGVVAVLAARSGRDARVVPQLPDGDLNGRALAGKF
jgi:VanZ family protein